MKWTDGITCYPESFDEIATVVESRKARDSHPHGITDSGGRWHPSTMETASCCKAIRRPSRAHPYSLMVHCRTKKHVQTWYAEHAVKIGEGVGVGVGIGYYAIYTGPNPTIEQLKARRAECIMFALGMHRRVLRAHPSDSSVIEWEHAREYWKQQAYHAHGEIMARTDSSAWY